VPVGTLGGGAPPAASTLGTLLRGVALRSWSITLLASFTVHTLPAAKVAVSRAVPCRCSRGSALRVPASVPSPTSMSALM